MPSSQVTEWLAYLKIEREALEQAQNEQRAGSAMAKHKSGTFGRGKR